MPRIQVQNLPPKKDTSQDDVIARFCYYFPQYTFQEALALPFRRIRQMLAVVDSEKAREYFILTKIAAAPHTKKGEGVKKLLNEFKKQMK